MKKLLYSLTLLLASSYQLQAQNNFKIYDINSGLGDSYPMYLTPYGTKIFFFANNGSKGWEPWAAGAVTTPAMLQDINPLTANSIDNSFTTPTAVVNNKVYFTADNGSSGTELFAYDGVNLPTVVRDIETGIKGSAPDNYTVFNNSIYLRARTDANGYELYRFLPGANTLDMLTDINIGADSSVTGNLIVYNSKIFFTAQTPAEGNELWCYDPLLDTAMIVADIDAGSGSSNPLNLVVYNGNLYFSAIESGYGRELYKYNGITAPQRVVDLVTGFQSGIPNFSEPIIGGFNNKVYFDGRDANGMYHVYVYDPSSGNTTLAFQTNPSGSSDPKWFTIYNGKLFFTANDAAKGNEWWVYDGTGNPTLLADLCTGANGSDPAEPVIVDGDLYFRARDCVNYGVELFRYNPTLGIQNVNALQDIAIYPNPATEELNIKLGQSIPGKVNIPFTNTMGQTVYEEKIASPNEILHINIAGWAQGIYMYRIIDETGKLYTAGKVTKE